MIVVLRDLNLVCVIGEFIIYIQYKYLIVSFTYFDFSQLQFVIWTEQLIVNNKAGFRINESVIR